MSVDGPAGAPAGEILPLRLPRPERSFLARAERLQELASGHPAAPFLELLARVARAQDAAARRLRGASGVPPSADRPLDRERWRRGPEWRDALRAVLAAARESPLPAPAREALSRIDAASDAEIEALADEVLSGVPSDLASAPFVGAALQAYFETLAASVDVTAVAGGGGGCPACGSPPVASVLLGDERLRYLACGLCGCQWHLPRVRCASCGDSASITYLGVENGLPGVKAEACGACKTYLKQFDLLDEPRADPVADDAATLVLDLLMGEQGYRRAGMNLLAPAGEPA